MEEISAGSKRSSVYIPTENRGKSSTVYLEKIKNSKTGNSEIIAAIVDNKSGRLKLNSPLTAEEYRDLRNEKKLHLELTDLRRDTEIGVMNRKSIAESVRTCQRTRSPNGSSSTSKTVYW
jgi:hypothetical protein